MTSMSKYTGSDFDEFLSDEGILEETTARAHRRLLVFQLEDATKLADERFIGMWRDREDMRVSSAWVRRVRESEWERGNGGEP